MDDECYISKYSDSFDQYYGYMDSEFAYLGGYITPDRKRCVYECTGIYKPGQNTAYRVCDCASQNNVDDNTCAIKCGENQKIVNGGCVCISGYIPVKDQDKCILPNKCNRTQMVGD